MKILDGTFQCRNIDNIQASPDNTKYMFLDLPNNFSVSCLKILTGIGLTDVLLIDDDRNVNFFESYLLFFIQKDMFFLQIQLTV